MKKYVKALGITGALAVMVPLSAFAATGGNSSSAGSPAAKPVDRMFIERAERFEGGSPISKEILDLLKLSEKAFREKVAGGKTLSQMAQEQGVSRDSLKKTLTDDFAKKQEEAKKRFADNLDKMIDSKPMKDHIKFGGPIMKFSMAEDFAAMAELLGITKDELTKSVASGKSLADIAKEKGVEVQKLIDAQKKTIEDGVKEALKAGALTQEQADKHLAEAGKLAENIVNGKGFAAKKGIVKKVERHFSEAVPFVFPFAGDEKMKIHFFDEEGQDAVPAPSNP